MTNAFLPHMYGSNCVVYTGTHDNDTMQGWLDNADDASVRLVAEYVFGKELSESEARKLCASGELCAVLVRCAIASTADMAVIPIQDILGVSSEGRMNTPSTVGANWTWRFEMSELTKERAENLEFLGRLYGRNIVKAE